MWRSRIIGTGSFVPSRRISNTELAQRLVLDAGGIARRTGIEARHWADAEQASSQLAEPAARAALEAAQVRVGDLDMILVSTTSADMIFPATACHLLRLLGGQGIPAFDLAASCSGFLYGLSMADVLIRSGWATRCLVVAAEVKSRYLDLNRKDATILFGDGAAAAVVSREPADDGDGPGVLAVRLYADGSYHGLVEVPAGGSRLPISLETVKSGKHTMTLKGGMLFRVAVRRLTTAAQDLLKEFQVGIDDLGQVIMHQANGRMLAAVAERLGLPEEKMYSVIAEYGNTSSASLPLALDHAVRGGRVRAGDLVLLGTFGGGLTWATALVRWG